MARISLSRSVIRPRAYPVRCPRRRRIQFSSHTGRIALSCRACLVPDIIPARSQTSCVQVLRAARSAVSSGKASGHLDKLAENSANFADLSATERGRLRSAPTGNGARANVQVFSDHHDHDGKHRCHRALASSARPAVTMQRDIGARRLISPITIIRRHSRRRPDRPGAAHRRPRRRLRLRHRERVGPARPGSRRSRRSRAPRCR
jgi:hypothetical protein